MTPQELYDFIINYPKGTKLREDPVIHGDLDLSATEITWLPDNLTVEGDLCLMYCWYIEVLPANLHVSGKLTITYTKIRAIPADLDVRGRIAASNLALKIPEGFTAHSDLYLNGFTSKGCPLEEPLELPDNLTVKGVLNITDRVLSRIPKNLVVEGRLECGTQQVDCLMSAQKFAMRGVIINGL